MDEQTMISFKFTGKVLQDRVMTEQRLKIDEVLTSIS